MDENKDTTEIEVDANILSAVEQDLRARISQIEHKLEVCEHGTQILATDFYKLSEQFNDVRRRLGA